MRAEVADRAGACRPLVEPPALGVGRAPVLEVGGAEVEGVAEVPGLEQLAGKPDGRDKAVVERAHVQHARLDCGLPHRERLIRCAAEWLLAEEMLPGRRGCDGGLGVHVVGAAVVEEVDRRIGEERLPVGDGALEAVAIGSGRDRVGAASGNRGEPGPERQRAGDVRQREIGVRVRLPHEGVPEHSDADRSLVHAANPTRSRVCLSHRMVRSVLQCGTCG